MMGCARSGGLRGPGCEDTLRDSCHRRALSGLGIDREMGDAAVGWARSGHSSSTSDAAGFR